MVEDGKPMRQNHYTMVEGGKTKDQVQGLDIATLLGAEGPQQGPQPSTGARRMGA